MGFQNGLAKTKRIGSISKATKLNKTEPKEDSKPDHMDISADDKYISWLVSSPLFFVISLRQIAIVALLLFSQ